MVLSRQARLAMFLERLSIAPTASTFEEDFGQIHDIMNAVEDEYSGVPYNPPSWQTDGRLYPPLPDSERAIVPPSPGLRLFRARYHKVYIGDNGAIEIRLQNEVLVNKPGTNGRRCVNHESNRAASAEREGPVSGSDVES